MTQLRFPCSCRHGGDAPHAPPVLPGPPHPHRLGSPQHRAAGRSGGQEHRPQVPAQEDWPGQIGHGGPRALHPWHGQVLIPKRGWVLVLRACLLSHLPGCGEAAAQLHLQALGKGLGFRV